jgi:hypothetical protein
MHGGVNYHTSMPLLENSRSRPIVARPANPRMSHWQRLGIILQNSVQLRLWFAPSRIP